MNLEAKAARYATALEQFVERVRDDSYVLAVVRIGTLSPELMWFRDGIQVWIVESDAVTLRRKSDGDDPRVFRTYTANGVNIWAEVIPRSRFKQMIDGTSRTAFTHSHFAVRQLVYSAERAIEKWFDGANRVATKDQRLELFALTTWLVDCVRHARRLLELKQDVGRAHSQVLFCARLLAATEIVKAGEIHEDDIVARARELAPELMASTHDALVGAAPEAGVVTGAIERVERELDECGPARLEAVVQYIEKQGRLVPLSELGDQWAYTQLYPWHLEAACEWLAEQGLLARLSTATRVTKKSSVEVEEPAYQVP